MPERDLRAAPDYTNPALIMLGVNLFCAFCTIWALWGLVPVLLLGAVLYHGIDRLAATRRRSH
jgi:hypothetical protein